MTAYREIALGERIEKLERRIVELVLASASKDNRIAELEAENEWLRDMGQTCERRIDDLKAENERLRAIPLDMDEALCQALKDARAENERLREAIKQHRREFIGAKWVEDSEIRLWAALELPT